MVYLELILVSAVTTVVIGKLISVLDERRVALWSVDLGVALADNVVNVLILYARSCFDHNIAIRSLRS